VIYLTEARTACTEELTFMDEVSYPQRVHWFPDTLKMKQTGMIYAPHKMAEKVMDAGMLKVLRENPVKTAFILASGNSHFSGIEPRSYGDTRLTYTFKFLPLALTQVYAGRMASACGAFDMVLTDASACASSLKVMMDVQQLIRTYGFDRVIVLGVEDQVANSVLHFFGEAGAVLTAKDDEKVLPSAFDEVNYGFHIGQGAVLAVFETEDSMKKTGFKPKAQLLGAYTSAEEFTNAIGQREDGQGFKRAIEGAMYVAQVQAFKLRTVKTHGTGTKSNNLAERSAISSVLKDFVATSFKQRIGHTMGASGLLETILLLDSIKNGSIPPIPNRTDQDSVFLSESAPAEKGGLILSLAAGMGNVYSAAIFKDAQC
jgi:3-oxoacyl-[acyl-carrier-protein] synthase II